MLKNTILSRKTILNKQNFLNVEKKFWIIISQMSRTYFEKY